MRTPSRPQSFPRDFPFSIPSDVALSALRVRVTVLPHIVGGSSFNVLQLVQDLMELKPIVEPHAF